MLGFAAGDALGTTLEFRLPGSFEAISDRLLARAQVAVRQDGAQVAERPNRRVLRPTASVARPATGHLGLVMRPGRPGTDSSNRFFRPGAEAEIEDGFRHKSKAIRPLVEGGMAEQEGPVSAWRGGNAGGCALLKATP